MKKRLVSVLLASAMVLSSFGMYAMADETEAAAPASKSSEAAPDWDDYNEKIAEIYQETDLAKREALMHEAEDELMDTWAVIPIYFYNDICMMNTE